MVQHAWRELDVIRDDAGGPFFVYSMRDDVQHVLHSVLWVICSLCLVSLLLSLALLVISIFTKDWSRLTTETTMWTKVVIDDYWGLWAWSSVMTTKSSIVRLQFNYDLCSGGDTVDACHALLGARVLAVVTVALEAGAVISAVVIECRGSRRHGLAAEYSCICLTLLHVIVAVLALVLWGSVQDTLRAQDMTSGTIHFGFSWYLLLISAACSIITVVTIVNHLSAFTAPYQPISSKVGGTVRQS